MNIRETVQAILLMGEDASRLGKQVFPELRGGSWEFTTSTPRTVRCVITEDGDKFVGIPDDRGVLWLAGCALIVGRDTWGEHKNSLSYWTNCKVESVTTDRFRVARMYGQTPVLVAL